jgi:hypothetical protein
VWIDERLQAGQDWQVQLGAAMRQSDVLIYALTLEALASEVCRWEVNEAIKLGKPILPVLLQARTPIPDWLGKVQYVDFSSGPTGEAVARLLGSLQTLMPSAPLTSLAATQPPSRSNLMIKLLSHPAFQGLVGVIGIILTILALTNGSSTPPTTSPAATLTLTNTITPTDKPTSTREALLDLDITATEAMFQRTVAARQAANATLMAENTRLASSPTPSPTPTYTPAPPSETPLSNPTQSEPTPQLPPPTAKPVVATVAASGVYPCDGEIIFSSGGLLNQVHVSPLLNSPRRAAVQQGATVHILDQRANEGADWYQIEYNDSTQKGWILTEYVKPAAACPK